VPFDAERQELTGSPTPLLEGLQVYLFTIAGNGSLVYSNSAIDRTEDTSVYFPGSTAGDNVLVWVDRKGGVETLGTPPRPYRGLRLSPDGERLAWHAFPQEETLVRDVWIYDIARSASTRLTFGEGPNVRPIWSPDGERIYFARGGAFDIFSKPADGSGEAEQLTAGAYRVPSSLSSDGKTLVFRQRGESGDWDIGMVGIESGGEPEVLLGTRFSEKQGILSPDDHWLAYVSNESGRDEVYVRPFPGPGGRVQVSTEGGTEAMWSRDGRELFYRNGDKMMSVAVSTDPDFFSGKPTLLFEKPFAMDPTHSNYDLAADGRFIMVQVQSGEQADQLNVVLNWFEDLKRLVPTN
jgi:serine/threonine-protein kinase